MTDSELVPVHLMAYDPDAELEIDNSGYAPVVENHDDLVESGQTYEEIRAITRESAERHDMDIVEPRDPLWRDEFDDLESGDCWQLDD